MTMTANTNGKRLIALAEQIATAAHDGQTDQSGHPYLPHPAWVAAACERDYDNPKTVMVAWLHDVVEDTNDPKRTHDATPVSLADLRAAGFPDDVVDAVDAITVRVGEARADYYARVKQNPLALAVKTKDIDHNADPERLALIEDQATRERLTAKYAEARRALGIAQPDQP